MPSSNPILFSGELHCSEMVLQIQNFSLLISKRRKTPKEYWNSIKASKKLTRCARIAEVQTCVDQRPRVTLNINGVDLIGLLDSGASISCLGRDAFENLKKCKLKWKEYQGSAVKTASGENQNIEGFSDVNVQFKGQTKLIRFYIIPTLSNVLYLGIDFWLSFGLLPQINELQGTVLTTEKEGDGVVPDMHILDDVQKSKLAEVVAIFPSSAKEGLGKTTLIKHSIEVGNAKPIKQRYHAVSPAIEKKMYDEVDRMIELDVIEESNSPWSSPVTIVAKSNGKSRLCLDARQVNNLTTKDAYPMPLIDSILSRLNETRFISSIDLKDAYWQIELDESAREKTAFTVPGRPLYQFKRMPFGLCNASQSMCRLMDAVIPSALRDRVFVYIDDLLVVAEDFDSHIERLEIVAKCLKRANLTINVEKSKFCMRSLKYLGHIIGNGQIKPDPDRIKCIEDIQTPKTVKQVRRFLGMTGWYRRYINNYAAISAPITDVLKKSDRFQWSAEAQSSFEQLKACLISAPVLIHPDFSKPFFVQCDASLSGVGGVLFQIRNGEEHPIAFMSKKLNTAQKNYSITELECLAAVLCVQKFRCYIEGMEFTIITDHASLKWLMGQKDLTGRLARWSLKLQIFNFTIEHRKGSMNVVPDTLSRLHVDEIIDVVGQPLDLSDPAFQSDEYRELIHEVSEHGNELPDVKVQDGVLYKRTKFRTGDDLVDSATVWKVWVPKNLRNTLIANAHQPPSASHGGADKTIDLVRRYYFWPGLSRDVREFVSRCVTCKESKAPNHILRPVMGKSLTAERVFQRLFIDLLGPYPRSKSGNTTILIVLDQLSKFVWLKPLRKASAVAIVQYLESDIFNMFGVPECMISDNGVQFVSKEFSSLMNRYGIEHVKTATHSPQANASERVNRSIIAAIRSYIEDDQSKWDVHLSSIASALRNAVHASMQHSPYYVVFGQHMIQHARSFSILRKLQSLPMGDLTILPPEEFKDAINEQVRERIQEAHDKNSKRYNLRSREIEYSPGQEVFIRSFRQSDAAANFNAKLSRQWLPARIVSRKGSCMYVVSDRRGKELKVAYHAKDIRT